MNTFHLIGTALVGLRANKVRSGLTILGIVIGVMSIILIVALGRGAEQLILGEIGGLGAGMIEVHPGKEPAGLTDFASTLYADSLNERDVVALKKKTNVPYADMVSPASIVSGSVSYGGETYRKAVVFGWSAEFMEKMFDVYTGAGFIYDDADIRANAKVALIGTNVKNELFGDTDAVGKNIKIKGNNMRVVGVYAPRGSVAFFNIDDIVLIPPTTAQTYFLGVDYYQEIDVQVNDPALVDATIADIERTLRETHNITGSEEDDFYVISQEGILNQLESILGILTAFLSSVVAISLLVGGIGVMNIMLVSVTERTREIGLRKAVGATEKDILRQFLFEAVFLTGVGGIIGILLGFLLSLGATLILSKALALSWEFSFPISAAFLGVGVSALVGVIFGIYPARKASQKSPIEALRYE